MVCDLGYWNFGALTVTAIAAVAAAAIAAIFGGGGFGVPRGGGCFGIAGIASVWVIRNHRFGPCATLRGGCLEEPGCADCLETTEMVWHKRAQPALYYNMI